jgi:hypothetical protein
MRQTDVGWMRRQLLAAVIGAGCGFVAYVFAGNIEGVAFFSIRQMVTGEKHLSGIVQHPNDRWIIPAIMAVFVLGGAAFGMRLAHRLHQLNGRNDPSATQR